MKSAELELSPRDTQLAHQDAHHRAQDPAAIAIVKLMESPDALRNVEAMRALKDMYLELRAADAEQQFAVAFNALQSEMPAVQANKPVPNNDGTVRYKFAPFEEIMAQVRPFLRKHGFTLTFSSDIKDDRVIQTCTLQHVAGHKRSNSFAARIGSGPPKASPTQADGAASTYAKRFALCDCLNIVIEKDQDARAEGACIAPDKAIYLREQVAATKSDEKMFLALAGAATYAEIREDKYDVLVAALEKKARAKAARGE